MDIYTRKGDDGTTGLFFGGRVAKDSARPEAYGSVDEVQSCIGLARAEAERGGEIDAMLIELERDLWVLMAELATGPDNRHKLVAGTTAVTAEMVTALERRIDETGTRFAMPKEFVVPGQNRISALLDVARTVARRAERASLAVAEPTSQVIPYLNRLSDLLWALARWQEAGETLRARAD
jgi:cob(I)alamin adenosyltransferase